jgi:hypothetical protein
MSDKTDTDVKTDPVRSYEARINEIMEGRRRGTLSETDEDRMLEQLDEIWRQLTDAQRHEVDPGWLGVEEDMGSPSAPR